MVVFGKNEHKFMLNLYNDPWGTFKAPSGCAWGQTKIYQIKKSNFQKLLVISCLS